MTIDSIISKDYQPKRDMDFVNRTYRRLHYWVNKFYSLHYNNTETLSRAAESPTIVLPNHQFFLDIVVEDFLVYKATGDHGFFLMRDSLPRRFERLGGLGIKRSTEMSHLSRKEKKEKGREKQNLTEEEMINLLYRKHVIVVHSQGTRAKDRKMYINFPNVRNLVDLQKKFGEQINFVPVEITYSAKHGFFGLFPFPYSDITLTVHDSINVPDKGYKLLAQGIKRAFRI